MLYIYYFLGVNFSRVDISRAMTGDISSSDLVANSGIDGIWGSELGVFSKPRRELTFYSLQVILMCQ